MKILIAGDWHSDIHEQPVSDALKNLNMEVQEFKWHEYFSSGKANILSALWLKFQNKYLFGPRIARLNADLIQATLDTKPDVVFIYRGTHIRPKTLRSLRAKDSSLVIVGYNNDDPFSPNYPRWQWRHFKSSIPLYTHIFAYRERNLSEYLHAGAKSTSLLMSWFTPEIHHPVELLPEDIERYDCDVAFVGHYENDERLQVLGALADSGLNVKIWGPSNGWDTALLAYPNISSSLPVVPVRGGEYIRAISGAKVVLSFYSKLNRDEYTRRVFEIPAIGSCLASIRTETVERLFREDEEIVLFSTSTEAVMKISDLLKNAEKRNACALGGFRRVYLDGHDVHSRMQKMVIELEALVFSAKAVASHD